MRKRIGSFLSKAIPFRAKGYGFFDLVRYTSHRLDILYLGKDYAHPLDILHIVYFHLHLSFEHSVFRLNQQADDIDIEVIGYRAGDRVQHANRVDTVFRMRSPKLLFRRMAIGQERLWTTTLPSSLIKPNDSSPGIGLQQSAMT